MSGRNICQLQQDLMTVILPLVIVGKRSVKPVYLRGVQ